MTSIPAFGASLLQNTQGTSTQTQSVDEILQNTPPAATEQAPDSYNNKTVNTPAPKKRGGFDWVTATGLLIVGTGAFFAGRTGWFGKHIQTWFGGRMSLSKVFNNIETKMSEYLGRDGVNVTSAKISKNGEGKNILRAEFENGSVKEFEVAENKSVIRLSEKNAPASGNDKHIINEVILFNRLDGSPRSRATLIKGKDGDVQAYTSFKGEDILNADFKESTGLFRLYQKFEPQRKYFFGLLGPKESKSVVHTYANPETGKPTVITRNTTLKNGKKVRIDQTSTDSGNAYFHFDNQEQLTKIVKGKDGNFLVQNLEYATNPEGKKVLSGVRYTDLQGNPLNGNAPSA